MYIHTNTTTHKYAHIHTNEHPVDTVFFTDYLCVQSQGLWDLYSDMELNMIPVLAGEEHCKIVVKKYT